MLFDLRSRGRRRTVRVIYVFLALLMLGGLLLFGVGTGIGGGFLTALTNNSGSTGSGNSALNAQVKSAVKATKRNPTSVAAWVTLIEARWSDAGSGSNYDSSTDSYTTSGLKELALLAQDFQRYSTLTKTPGPEVSQLAAEAYGHLGQYKNEGDTWQDVIVDEPKVPNPYECLAVSADAAKQTREAALATSATLKLVPKVDLTEVKADLTEAAKTLAFAKLFAAGPFVVDNEAVNSPC